MMTKQSKNITLSVLFVTFLVLIVATSIVGITFYKPQPTTLQGEIEAEQVRISGKLPGRITRLYVAEGEWVRQGDTLVAIYSPEALAKRQQAEAMESVAVAEQRKVYGGTRSEIVAAAEQMWQGAIAQRKVAEQTYRRIERLLADSVVSRQRYDEAQALYASTLAAERAAKQNYLMAKRGAQQEDKNASKGLTDAAQGIVSEVDATLNDAYLTAPCDGFVAAIYPNVGELVGVGTPIMSISQMERAYAVMNVREDHLPHFTIGGEFVAEVPAIGAKKVTFEVYYIAPLGSYATWPSDQKAGSYDMRTFAIKARPVEPHEGLRPGMSVLLTLPDSRL